MKPFRLTSAYARPRHAFTLVELLVVMAIIAILAALTIPATFSLLRSSNVSKASAMISDELNLDRQLSLSKNRDVQIHFYSLGSKGNASDLKYRAFRSFSTTGTSTTLVPIGNMRYLPEPVIIGTGTDASGNKISTLLDTTVPGPTAGSENVPGVTTTTPYVSFTFRPTGGTNLSATSSWFMTLYLENAPVNGVTGVPVNYLTAQVDPVTGRVRIYRP